MSTLKRTWADISLDNLAFNYESIRKKLRPGCKFLAVVKADAYGHGAVRAARLMSALGADYLAVATIDEAVELRKAGLTLPILILGYTPAELTDTLIENDLTQTVFDLESAKEFSGKAEKLGRRLKAHIKADTGMTRLGFIYQDDRDEYNAVRQIKEACSLPGIKAEGIFTHFANADVKKDPYTLTQFKRFTGLIKKLGECGVQFDIRHCANSSAIVYYPETHLDMVRPGIILYGSYPAEEMRGDISLKPVMSLRSVISQIKTLPEGVAVSYGCTFRTKRETRVAVVEIGYADGLHRTLSSKGSMLVHGKKAPIIGRICMDRCMLDVTDIPEAKAGDTATVFGCDGDCCLPAEEAAGLAGTISYELFCSVAKRVPRNYK
ncbi:MAG: alanine racemase [Bacillota bacterium]|nr:alanine racemase [Bacillota bacterium]